jgi:hypothetical protein
MIIERVLKSVPKPDPDIEARAQEAAASMAAAISAKETAEQVLSEAKAHLKNVIEEFDLMKGRYEDSQSALTAANLSLEMERAAHNQTRMLLESERAERARDDRLVGALAQQNFESPPAVDYEIRVTGRDDTGRLLSLKLTKAEP